jgi:predicted lipoprotein with Yx(FWY)xxD motif
MRRAIPVTFFTAVLLVVLGLASCGGTSTSTQGSAGGTAAATATATPQPPVVVVKVKSAKVSNKATQVLGDLKGKTLYYFTADKGSQIACTGSCTQLWPPLLAPSGNPAAQTTLPGTFGVVNGPNGRQVTYNGHPLYTYAKDEDAEDAYGQGVDGRWFAATPNLSA